MGVLSDDEVRAGLAGALAAWELAGGEITRQLRFPGFADAIAFVVRLSYEAEAADHHPDIEIHYNRVGLRLSTHSQGGVTAKDLALAAAVERLARAAQQ